MACSLPRTIHIVQWISYILNKVKGEGVTLDFIAFGIVHSTNLLFFFLSFFLLLASFIQFKWSWNERVSEWVGEEKVRLSDSKRKLNETKTNREMLMTTSGYVNKSNSSGIENQLSTPQPKVFDINIKIRFEERIPLVFLLSLLHHLEAGSYEASESFPGFSNLSPHSPKGSCV